MPLWKLSRAWEWCPVRAVMAYVDRVIALQTELCWVCWQGSPHSWPAVEAVQALSIALCR